MLTPDKGMTKIEGTICVSISYPLCTDNRRERTSILNKSIRQLAHIGALWWTTAKKSEVAFNSGRRVKIQVYQNQYHIEGDTRAEFVIYADFVELEDIEGMIAHEHPF